MSDAPVQLLTLPRRWRLSLDDLCSRYLQGESVESLARACGLKYAGPVCRVLHEVGVLLELFCPKCFSSKPYSDFYMYKGKVDLASCKKCRSKQNTKYRQDNPTPDRDAAYRDSRRDTAAYQNRAWRLKKSYNLTVEQYEKMLAAQHGCCLLCGTDDPSPRSNFAVDHDHSCCSGAVTCGNCVRGLLCFPCNFAIGYVESKWDFQRVTEYLRRPGE